MAARRRAAAGKRWSANATVILYGRDGAVLPTDTTAAPHRAQVRWRVDGRQRKRTITAPELQQLPGLLADLRAAYEHDCRPLVPGDARRQPYRRVSGDPALGRPAPSEMAMVVAVSFVQARTSAVAGPCIRRERVADPPRAPASSGRGGRR
jgi:hypothetical protein